MDKISIGDRMKNYEKSTNYKIIPRLPVIVHLDGKNFSSFTKRLKLPKPFCDEFSKWMIDTMLYVSNQIQGCLLGYTQSDEITFVLSNNQTLETIPWLGNRIQKINSVITSMTTSIFNSKIRYIDKNLFVHFDCRVFPVPNLVEAANCLVWRQNDCIKNSISTATYYELSKCYSRKSSRQMMYGLNQEKQKQLLLDKTSIDWNSYAEKFKMGIISVKEQIEITTENGSAIKNKWISSPAFHFSNTEGKIKLYEILYKKHNTGENVE